MSFAKGLGDETRFSFRTWAMSNAMGKIAPVAKSSVSNDALSLNWVLASPTKVQTIAPATGMEIDLFVADSKSALSASRVKGHSSIVRAILARTMNSQHVQLL